MPEHVIELKRGQRTDVEVHLKQQRDRLRAACVEAKPLINWLANRAGLGWFSKEVYPTGRLLEAALESKT